MELRRGLRRAEATRRLRRRGVVPGGPHINQLALPEQNARVEAVLAIGGTRAQEALYSLADYDSSQDSSGDEWYPVKRVARRPHTGLESVFMVCVHFK